MADAHTGMGPLTPAPKLNPNCQCICHTQPGIMHVAACCTAPDLIPRADAELAVVERAERDALKADRDRLLALAPHLWPSVSHRAEWDQLLRDIKAEMEGR